MSEVEAVRLIREWARTRDEAVVKQLAETLEIPVEAVMRGLARMGDTEREVFEAAAYLAGYGEGRRDGASERARREVVYRGLQLAAFADLSPETLIAWLEAKGWKRRTAPRFGIAVFRKQGRDVIVPLDRGFSDFAERMADAASIAGRVEGIKAETVAWEAGVEGSLRG